MDDVAGLQTIPFGDFRLTRWATGEGAAFCQQSWSRDPVDRALVATAQLYDCPLITSDEAIQRFYAKSIW